MLKVKLVLVPSHSSHHFKCCILAKASTHHPTLPSHTLLTECALSCWSHLPLECKLRIYRVSAPLP